MDIFSNKHNMRNKYHIEIKLVSIIVNFSKIYLFMYVCF